MGFLFDPDHVPPALEALKIFLQFLRLMGDRPNPPTLQPASEQSADDVSLPTMPTTLLQSFIPEFSTRTVRVERLLQELVFDIQSPAPQTFARLAKELGPVINDYRTYMEAQVPLYLGVEPAAKAEEFWQALYGCSWQLHDHLAAMLEDGSTKDDLPKPSPREMFGEVSRARKELQVLLRKDLAGE